MSKITQDCAIFLTPDCARLREIAQDCARLRKIADLTHRCIIKCLNDCHCVCLQVLYFAWHSPSVSAKSTLCRHHVCVVVNDKFVKFVLFFKYKCSQGLRGQVWTWKKMFCLVTCKVTKCKDLFYQIKKVPKSLDSETLNTFFIVSRPKFNTYYYFLDL